MKQTYYRMDYEEINGHTFSKRDYVNFETNLADNFKEYIKTESNLSDEEVLKMNFQEDDNLTTKMENYFIPQMARDIS